MDFLIQQIIEKLQNLPETAIKALSVINLPNDAMPKIQAIAENDAKEYNRKIAQAIVKKIL